MGDDVRVSTPVITASGRASPRSLPSSRQSAGKLIALPFLAAIDVGKDGLWFIAVASFATLKFEPHNRLRVKVNEI
ncbi:MAG: hypothetical protein ACI8W8_001185 [Rhodothermales bacterium]|jgi:hypothetical protein